MKSRSLISLASNALRAAAVIAIAAAAALQAEETWRQFRGPNADGKSDAIGLPTTWSETNNIKWKTPLVGKAWSCPVVFGDQVWMTSATKDGKKLSVYQLDRATGKIEKDQLLFEVENPQFCHDFNSYASPTPVIEKGRVYVTFGSPGTACLDTKTGQKIWERTDLICNHYRGAGSSPVRYKNLLIMNFDGSDQQYVIALDKDTGKTVWKTNRSIDFQDLKDGKPEADGDWRKAFSTPRIATMDGRELLISLGSKALYAYDPATGTDIWRVEERKCHSGSSQPAVIGDMVYACMGFSRGQLLAIKPGKLRGVLEETNVVWRGARNVALKPSVIIDNGLLYMIDDGGILSCLDAATGEEIWRERVQGNYSASPILAEGRLYVFSEEGKCTVLQAGREHKVLATNLMPEGIMSTPAIAGKAIYLRTKGAIYRIEQ
jgi:outer membrane protein assembly factor BamB